MWQLLGLPSTQEDKEEKRKYICFLQKKVIACLWKPDEENYGYVRMGNGIPCLVHRWQRLGHLEAAHLHGMWQLCWGW